MNRSLRFHDLFLNLAIACLLWSCAQVRGISGGEKDLNPPIVIRASPPNQSTNFSGNTITLTFDEYVQAGSLLQNLIISPPLTKTPRLNIKGKSIILTIPEELKASTTYVFQFGDGISDVNEANMLTEFAYVLSTGTAIDSLQVSGSVIEAWTGLPVKGMKAMLFDAAIRRDSIGQKPLYFSKTDASGAFVIPFLKSGEYRIELLEDLNNNFAFDAGEKLAFQYETLNPIDSTSKNLKFEASTPKPFPLLINDVYTDSSGFFAFTWPIWFDLPEVRMADSELKVIQLRKENSDTVYHWIEGKPVGKELMAFVEYPEMENDSLDVLFFARNNRPFADLLPIESKINYDQKFELFSRQKIADILQDNMVMLVDSIRTDPEITLHADSNKISVFYDWQENVSYKLIFASGGVFAQDKSTNDSLVYNVQFNKKADFGSLTWNFKETQMIGNVFILTDADGKTVFSSILDENHKLNIINLKPGDYTARVFRDDSTNMIWDPIDYQSLSLSEPISVYPDKIQVRANWEIVLEW